MSLRASPNLAPLPLQLLAGPAALLPAQWPPEQPLPAHCQLPRACAAVALPGEHRTPAARWWERSCCFVCPLLAGGAVGTYLLLALGAAEFVLSEARGGRRPMMTESGRRWEQTSRSAPRRVRASKGISCATRSPPCGSVCAAQQLLLWCPPLPL